MSFQISENIKGFFANLREYLSFLRVYFKQKLFRSFYRFEKGKDILVGALVIKRGKHVQAFLHTSISGLFLIGMMMAPLIKGAFSGKRVGGGWRGRFSGFGYGQFRYSDANKNFG